MEQIYKCYLLILFHIYPRESSSSFLPHPPCRQMPKYFIPVSSLCQTSIYNELICSLMDGQLLIVKNTFWHSNLRQRGLNYTLSMYINDVIPVLLPLPTTEWHWGWLQHSESQQLCTESQRASHSHAVFESLSQRKLPTWLNPFIIGMNATLVCWSLSSVTLNFPKKTY